MRTWRDSMCSSLTTKTLRKAHPKRAGRMRISARSRRQLRAAAPGTFAATKMTVDDVNGILRLPLLGVIADEPEIIVTTNKGEPIALRKEGQTASAYHAIAARIAGEDVAAPTVELKESFLDKLGAFFGGRR